MSRNHTQPPPLLRPALPEDDPVAALAREAGRRAAEAARARWHEKARRRAARAAAAGDAGTEAPGPRPGGLGTPAAAAPAASPAQRGTPPAVANPGAPAPGHQAGRATSSARPARPPPAGRSPSRRSAARRARRRGQALAAAGLLGAVSIAAITGLYQLVGRAPEPTGDQALVSLRAAPLPSAAPTWTASQAAVAPQPSPAPTTGPAPVAATAALTAPPPPAAPATAAAPRVSAAGRGAAAVLPYLPGSQVVESDAEPQQAPGGGTTWAATISSTDPVDRVAAYYRQLLNAEARPSGATLTEVTPGPGQVLLSLGNPGDGSHSAVWIGNSDGQVLIRLMRTQGPAASP